MGETAGLAADRQQNLMALAEANRVRRARAEMKRQIAAGRLDVTEILLTCPWQAESMEVSDLVRSQKGWGHARCRRLFISLGVRENKPIGTLTDRQRTALVGMLRQKASPPGHGAREPMRALTAA